MHKAWNAALAVIEKLEEAGYEAVIVGGAVRDYVMKRPFSDVDVATNAKPEEVKQVFLKTIDVGIQHGTVLVLYAGDQIEVTTYRKESIYSDHRRPDSVQFVRTLKDDLERRDFTMNALAMRASGEIVDYYGGKEDIANGIIRAVGNASERFQEDALRMLRAVRFCAQLGFRIEEVTMQAIRTHAPLLHHIAVERIAKEMEKLFESANCNQGIGALIESGLSRELPGEFLHADWKYMTFEKAEEGWAYLYCLHADEYPSILKNYKCSNQVKKFAAKIHHLVQMDEWDVFTLFDYSLEVLVFASKVRKAFGKNTLEQREIVQMKEALPIQSMQELVVTGKELLQWNGNKRGPWVKEHLLEVKRAVLTREVENDGMKIKEWYNEKFNKG